MASHVGANLGNLADKLVPQDVTRAHEWDVAADQVQIRSAGHAAGYLDDDVLSITKLRIRNVLDREVVDPAPQQRFHSLPPCRP